MEFFTGFQWAVPKAFSDAVALCQFEEGDMLYDTKVAYDDDWSKAKKAIEYSLQVRHPIRASGGISGKKFGNGVFKNNWFSEIRIDFYKNHKLIGEEQILSTQGRLYTALWKGDMSILKNTQQDPLIPLTLQDVTKKLENASPKAKELSIGPPVFVMARDLSNPVSRDKYSNVLSKLKGHLHNSTKILTPEEAGIIPFENIAPTVDIVFFPMDGITANELHDFVKSAVYIPSKKAKKDMFRISAHGIIV